MSQQNNQTGLPQLPFERNHYFYGKLITTRDMTDEQAYFNEKRWLLNRLLFGSGIVCGLEVTGEADAPMLQIASGVALDGLGREIVVTEKKTVSLAGLSNLPALNDGEKKPGFICLAYEECPREPLPALASTACEEVCDFNRIREGFHVKWSDQDGQSLGNALCEKQVTRWEDAEVIFERVAPVWVRAGEVFEIAFKLTAKADLNNVRWVEGVVTGGQLIEPIPTVPHQAKQFPTPPVNLQAGEFFAYVYQVRAGAVGASRELAQTASKLTLAGATVLTGGMEAERPAPISDGDVIPAPAAPNSEPSVETTIEVVSEDEAQRRENLRRGQISGQTTGSLCLTLAAVEVQRSGSAIKLTGPPAALTLRRFRYSLEHLANLFECVRTQVLATPGSPRPGHAFITINDLEQAKPRPIGRAADEGNSFTASHGNHAHALPLRKDGGLEFKPNASGADELRINGNVDGENINFLSKVAGQDPTASQQLTTKRYVDTAIKQYVDSRIAGLDWQESVKDKDLSAPLPGPPPAKGDRYLLLNAPTAVTPGNPWGGHRNSIAEWTGTAWDFNPPTGLPDEGTAVFVEDEDRAYLFVNSSWIEFLAVPKTAAGDGLDANGAILFVGKGKGIIVNPNDVQVDFENGALPAIGSPVSPANKDTAARGDHSHELPLANPGGLEFDAATKRLRIALAGKGGLEFDSANKLRINGEVDGDKINFLKTVSGQDPANPPHLTTKKYVDDQQALMKQYVDSKVAGLDWQESVKDKDLPAPPTTPRPAKGDRYLLLKVPLTRVSDNPWSGHLNEIAEWNGSVWDFTNPDEGTAAFVEDDDRAYLHTNGGWTEFLAVPKTAAGDGLDANGAILFVGKGKGIIVNPNDVQVDFENGALPAIGSPVSPATKDTAARGDHSHELPLANPGGLEFDAATKRLRIALAGKGGLEFDSANKLRLNGEVDGDKLKFNKAVRFDLLPLSKETPTAPEQLTTKNYVDEQVARAGSSKSLIANGVVMIELSNNPAMEIVTSPINPQLGPGPICVVLGVVDLKQRNSIHVGDLIHISGLHQDVKIHLSAEVVVQRDEDSVFLIHAQNSEPEKILPERFHLRYWAFRPNEKDGAPSIEVKVVPPRR